jgi:hypothetical protein
MYVTVELYADGFHAVGMPGAAGLLLLPLHRANAGNVRLQSRPMRMAWQRFGGQRSLQRWGQRFRRNHDDFDRGAGLSHLHGFGSRRAKLVHDAREQQGVGDQERH